jgi:hypothetical protein
MKFEPWLPVYGDTSYRGDCPKEGIEQVTFFSRLRREYPDTYGKLGVHPKNEEKRSGKDFHRLAVDKAMGLTPGASDIIIPGAPSFVCEMKRRDHTKSQWQDEQLPYLKAAHETGCFVCVALGADAAWEAFQEWHG